MNSKLVILISLIFIFILTSCEKEPLPEPTPKPHNGLQKVTASGQVLNKETGLPIANISVSLKQRGDNLSYTWNYGSAPIENTKTDEEGYYSFAVEIPPVATFLAINSNPNNGSYSDITVPLNINLENKDLDFQLDPKSTLRVIAQTDEPLGENDFIALYLPNESCHCDDLTSISAVGGTENKARLTVRRNGETTVKDVYIFCPLDEKTTYYINY